jgi:hypothetical protein
MGAGEDVMGTVDSCVKESSDIDIDVMCTVHSCVKESVVPVKSTGENGHVQSIGEGTVEFSFLIFRMVSSRFAM